MQPLVTANPNQALEMTGMRHGWPAAALDERPYFRVPSAAPIACTPEGRDAQVTKRRGLDGAGERLLRARLGPDRVRDRYDFFRLAIGRRERWNEQPRQ